MCVILIYTVLVSICVFPVNSLASRYGHIKNINQYSEPEIKIGEPGSDPTLRNGFLASGTGSAATNASKNDQTSFKSGKSGLLQMIYFYLMYYSGVLF